MNNDKSINKVRKTKKGFVVKCNSSKTITVKIDNRIQHPKYKKYLNKFLFFKVHDNYNQCKVGDIAIISECRKLSKTKTWELVSIV